MTVYSPPFKHYFKYSLGFYVHIKYAGTSWLPRHLHIIVIITDYFNAGNFIRVSSFLTLGPEAYITHISFLPTLYIAYSAFLTCMKQLLHSDLHCYIIAGQFERL